MSSGDAPCQGAIPPGDSRSQAAQVVRILTGNDCTEQDLAARTSAQEFIGRWIGFNTIYRVHPGATERDRLMECVRGMLTGLDAGRILSELDPAIAYLGSRPPGNMRYRASDPEFRARTSKDMGVAQDASRPAVERLAHLIAVVYQIRCNLFHGQKGLASSRDRRLVRIGDEILGRVLEVAIGAAKPLGDGGIAAATT